jgi:hypothetical protein
VSSRKLVNGSIAPAHRIAWQCRTWCCPDTFLPAEGDTFSADHIKVPLLWMNPVSCRLLFSLRCRDLP